jgi:cobalt-zinc-cadmium efflux system outer membrane protein
VLSQPLPFKRLDHQRKAAEALLSSAQSGKDFQQLQLEYEMAMVFHRLQWTAAELALSEQRLQTARKFQGRASGKKDLLVRYLSPLEHQRLDILRETARQSIATAEGEYNEALARFKTLLALDESASLQVAPLMLMDQPGSLQALQRGLDKHPQLAAIRHEVEAAQVGVDVARATRFADPTLNVYWEQDNFAGSRESYNGVSLNLEIPLWNASKARISSARSEAIRARSSLELQQRDLSSQLHQSYIHLGHLISQSQAYRDKLLKPAREVFELTRKGFEAGELNILSLIDANNTYFDSRSGYLKLLANVGFELANLRLAAGLTALTSEPEAQGALK